ncbi:type II toxin-antitoxin system RelE/ParE family toxin [Flavimarina sp. Hel_I_48]|uniref:type II toxin-antitoxin system RelE/ParE family toxin n=1 Tax=Flavimarina sp. Hel_I_48 TaxID=1392488 RepID=UPI0004DEE6E4|nr:type II toxin-antitoxin system RelE/ParE family toxin [Flavimarina sp. Hel_I_48]
MIRDIIISKTAEKNLDKIFEYLEGRWSLNVKHNFVEKLDTALELLKRDPNMFPESLSNQGLHKCVITKHNFIFYRFNSRWVKIITIFDTRQNPKKTEQI